MCGIVGYIGERNAAEVLVKGLKRLEYRGYDSAGITVTHDGVMTTVKAKGRLDELEKRLGSGLPGNAGIGHTRWATHGKPSDANSHPHESASRRYSVVHNGIIENYLELKEELLQAGVAFRSETDTEVIPNLLDQAGEDDLLTAALKVAGRLRGSYALCIMDREHPGELVAVRKDSPLVIGAGNGESFVASDIPALLDYTRDVYILLDGEAALVRPGEILFRDQEGREIKKEALRVDWSLEAAEKQGYDHFMLKEIHEQPEAVRKTLAGRLQGDHVSLGLEFGPEYFRNINKIAMVACGTASYAGAVAGNIIESRLRIPVLINYASEFRYNDPLVDEKTLTVVISQSGETADTLAGLREARKKGSKVLAISNVVESSIAREADQVLYTQAGPEIAVASTKAYVAQLTLLYLLIMEMGVLRGDFSREEEALWVQDIRRIPEKIQAILDSQEQVKACAEKIKEAQSAFFIGRGRDSISCLEGALKLKEISYIHAEAYPAGELKHGTIALITPQVPVVAVATDSHLLEKTISNIIEVKARGAVAFGVSFEGVEAMDKVADHLLPIPWIREDLSPILAVVPLQLLAYYASVARGNDVDKPRNLAKSVTVE